MIWIVTCVLRELEKNECNYVFGGLYLSFLNIVLGKSLRFWLSLIHIYAAKYTPEGGNVCLLTERLRTEGNVEWVRFTVRDSGIGMSEEFLEHAFEPFSQEGNRTLALQWQGDVYKRQL